MHQLTGLGDDVYVEAVVRLHGFDARLDMLVCNRTAHTLSDCSLELLTTGDLKVVERPHGFVLEPRATVRLHANVKVSSTDAGTVFGTVEFERSGGAGGRRTLTLNSVRVDVLDYIRPARCDDAKFRSMWAQFEWENKIAVATNFTDPVALVKHIARITNMRLLTPDAVLERNREAVVAKMYGRSVFGDKALLNVSLERTSKIKRVLGFVRVRSKSQCIALALGERVQANQRMPPRVAAAVKKARATAREKR